MIGGGSAGACDDALTDSLAYLVSEQLLPLVPELLREDKPIPVWALKVVEECLESLPATTIPTLERCLCCSIRHYACLAASQLHASSSFMPHTVTFLVGNPAKDISLSCIPQK